MKKSLRDRALALLLAMTMVVGMLPTTALADGGSGTGGGTTGATVNHPPNASAEVGMTFMEGREFLRVTVVRVPITSEYGDLVFGTPTDEEMKAEFDLMKLDAIKASGYTSWTLDFPTKGNTAEFASTSTRWALTIWFLYISKTLPSGRAVTCTYK